VYVSFAMGLLRICAKVGTRDVGCGCYVARMWMSRAGGSETAGNNFLKRFSRTVVVASTWWVRMTIFKRVSIRTSLHVVR
jgi:hypothetical protein